MSLPSTRTRPGRPVGGLPVHRRALGWLAEHAQTISAASEAVNAKSRPAHECRLRATGRGRRARPARGRREAAAASPVRRASSSPARSATASRACRISVLQPALGDVHAIGARAEPCHAGARRQRQRAVEDADDVGDRESPTDRATDDGRHASRGGSRRSPWSRNCTRIASRNLRGMRSRSAISAVCVHVSLSARSASMVAARTAYFALLESIRVSCQARAAGSTPRRRIMLTTGPLLSTIPIGYIGIGDSHDDTLRRRHRCGRERHATLPAPAAPRAARHAHHVDRAQIAVRSWSRLCNRQSQPPAERAGRAHERVCRSAAPLRRLAARVSRHSCWTACGRPRQRSCRAGCMAPICGIC